MSNNHSFPATGGRALPKVEDIGVFSSRAGNLSGVALILEGMSLEEEEHAMRAANNIKTLYSVVKPLFAAASWTVPNELKFSELEAYMKVVVSYPKNTAEDSPAIGRVVPEGYPADVKNRKGAVWALREFLDKNIYHTSAFCYGFYLAHSERTAVMGEGTCSEDRRLRNSYSLAKLKNKDPGSYFLGLEAYKDYLAAMSLQARHGSSSAVGQSSGSGASQSPKETVY